MQEFDLTELYSLGRKLLRETGKSSKNLKAKFVTTERYDVLKPYCRFRGTANKIHGPRRSVSD